MKLLVVATALDVGGRFDELMNAAFAAHAASRGQAAEIHLLDAEGEIGRAHV